MAKTTGIPWCRSTANPWIGCSKVSVSHADYLGACDNCYAELQDGRGIFGGAVHWGPGVLRLRTSEANWNEWRKWNRLAPASEFAGVRGFWPVFSASLADIFDNEVPDSWREDFWALVRECRNLTFLVLTKRIGNARKGMLPADFSAQTFPHVWLGASICSQPDADRDIDKLLSINARCHFLSMEPLLGPVKIERWLDRQDGVDWVIAGPESGPRAREMDLAWPRDIRNQCAARNVAFFMKQIVVARKKLPIDEWPEDLRIQEFPIAADDGINGEEK